MPAFLNDLLKVRFRESEEIKAQPVNFKNGLCKTDNFCIIFK